MDNKMLEDIGLAPSEMKVYETLLKTGSVKAGELTNSIDLHRSRIYDAINRLINKGLVSYVIKNGIKYFEASSPDRLLEYVKEQKARIDAKEKEIREMIPELKRQMPSPMIQAEAHVLYGKEGFKTMRNDVLKQGKDIYLIGGKGKEYRIFEYYFPQFNKQRIKKKIKFKILADYGVKWIKENQELKLSEFRSLPEGYSTPCVINVYGDRVVNVLWQEDNPICFMIINKGIADSYRKWFDLMWKNAK